MARHKIDTPEGRAESEKYRATMRAKYGADGVKEHYKQIGRKGGENGRGPNYTGGFAGNVEKARLAGSKGGSRSRRGLRYIGEDNGFYVYKDENGGTVRYQSKMQIRNDGIINHKSEPKCEVIIDGEIITGD